jgi:hypothetical protein
MSDLVERVSKAIARQRWTEEAADPNLIDAEVEYGWDTYTDEARAAIKAVADFLHQEDDEYSDDSSLYRASVFLRARLKEGSE